MGEAKRRKEIALQRHPEYNSDPLVPWSKPDFEKLMSTFGELLEPNHLKNLARQGFRETGRGAVLLSIFKGKPMAFYKASSLLLLDLYESGFKNRLQEKFYEYNPRTQVILVVTYNDLTTSDECVYDSIIGDF